MTAYNFVLLGFATVYTAGLFVLSNLPASRLPGPLRIGGFDKLYHMGAFALLTILLLEGISAKDGWWRIALVAVIVLCVGGAIEIVQPHFGRTSSLADWVADFAGLLAALTVWASVRFLR